jgi:lysophospholipase L1-like esterase
MPLWLFYFAIVFNLLSIPIKAETYRVACVGDSITQGARVDAETQSYPARLAQILGSNFEIRNFGVGGATMLHVGKPTVWSKLEAIKEFQPHYIVIALGTNDTVEGHRRNWSRIDRFESPIAGICSVNCSNYLHIQPFALRGLLPWCWKRPGLSEERRANLVERKPRLEQLRGILKKVVEEMDSEQLYFLDLAPVFNGRPELLTEKDGVHPNKNGYQELAVAVARSLQSKHGDTQSVRKDRWQGYERQHFKVQGRSAWVVVPLKAAEGRPWIWRARFPGFHAEMDHQLVGHGFHVGYVDVAGLFGGPDAMEMGDAFYHFVTKRYQLSEKPVMEGVSRGGLFVYHWAMRHPEWVSAIYCDTPVCDPKSWPGGKGIGMGSTRDWNRFMEVNGLTAETSEAFRAPIFKNYGILVQYQDSDHAHHFRK